MLATIDLVRVIQQNEIAGGDFIDAYLRSLYGANGQRYLFLKQAISMKLYKA